MKDQAIDDSTRNIAYLNEEGVKTDALGAKQAIYMLLQSEINKLMVARGANAFALKILDPAEPSEEPSFPKHILWVLAGFFSGLFLSIIFLIYRIK